VVSSSRASFVDGLRAEIGLSDMEFAVLASAGVRGFAGLYDLLRTFPSVAALGVDLPRLSAYAVAHMPAAVRERVAGSSAATPPRLARAPGVRPPAGAAVGPGYVVGMPAAPQLQAAPGGAAPPGQAHDLRLPHWPVRDQGDRGTCVAFSAVACLEHALGLGAASGRLSEQFLYWAIKTGTRDPLPHSDGSSLEFAREALQQHGVCEDARWPYDPQAWVANVTQATPPHAPSKAAQKDAQARRHAGSVASPAPGSGAAAQVLAELRARRAVAISVPMFQDPSGQYPGNWESPGAWSFGEVLNPPISSVATGYGHAVCVTGFVPDASEPHGGHFIFRNSWGPVWGANLPTAGLLGPEPGYGQVSATYVEDYLWQWLVL
jgi:Papain family cysteine protease